MKYFIYQGLLAGGLFLLPACGFSPFFVVEQLTAPAPSVSVEENKIFNIYLPRGTSPKADWKIKTQPDPSIATFVEQFDDIAFATSTGYRFKSHSTGQTRVVFTLEQTNETLEKTFTITVTKK